MGTGLETLERGAVWWVVLREGGIGREEGMKGGVLGGCL